MIEVQHLVKEYRHAIKKEGKFASIRSLFHTEYRTKRAVDDISFSIGEGELVGYIGPNGAGKSTSIKMLSGILVPTAGQVTVGGKVPHRDRKENARQIGVVFGQKTQLWWDVPVIESLRLLRDIYKVPAAQYQRNMELFRGLLDLHEFENRPVRQLSLGQRMRADLAASLLHDPKILFLDEPTIGVDIVAKARLRDFILEINRERKVTVLLTTHDMADIEKLCSRILIIDKGRILYDGGLEQIRTSLGRHRTLVVEFEGNVEDFTVPKAELTRSDGVKKWFRFDRGQTTPAELIPYISSRYPILDLTVEEPAIEDMVRGIYEHTAAPAGEVPG